MIPIAQSFGPFGTGSGATIDEAFWRELFGNLFTPGILKGAIIDGWSTASADLSTAWLSGLTVRTGSGVAIIKGFGYKNTADVDQTVADRHATLDRIDRVVLKMDFTAKTIGLAIHAGTNGGGLPALSQTSPAWEIPIARVAVTHNANPTLALTAGDVTDDRQYAGVIAPAAQGAGSGLNADSVDGLAASAFVQGSGASQHIVLYTGTDAPGNGVGANGDVVLWYRGTNPFAPNASQPRPWKSFPGLLQNGRRIQTIVMPSEIGGW